ncbi:uncharacterized protein LOC143253797 isoform X3 [Tachypleus tridentatus]|uniref:uncharacterized protein LOC143253797 isoform X3 n=1 Tax=Tachypleus tridentatus TaxID=6853 RepID=UPI003FD350EC
MPGNNSKNLTFAMAKERCRPRVRCRVYVKRKTATLPTVNESSSREENGETYPQSLETAIPKETYLCFQKVLADLLDKFKNKKKETPKERLKLSKCGGQKVSCSNQLSQPESKLNQSLFITEEKLEIPENNGNREQQMTNVESTITNNVVQAIHSKLNGYTHITLNEEVRNQLTIISDVKRKYTDLRRNWSYPLQKKTGEEQILQTKIRELLKNIQQLEKQCKRLQLENQTLKQKRESERDRELHKLRIKNDELTSNVQKVRNKNQFLQQDKTKNDVRELQTIIRQSSKERLELERHLSRAIEATQKTANGDVSKYVALEQTNQALRLRLEELDRLVDQQKHIELRLTERGDELTKLKKELDEQRNVSADLENQLQNSLDQKSELETQLQQQLGVLEPVCHHLKNSLQELHCKYRKAHCDIDCLQDKLSNLETLVKHMREAAEKRKELEKEHTDALAELQKYKAEVWVLGQSKESEKQQSLELIKSLESKVRELQKKCELQNVLHEELVLEMAALRRSQAKRAWSTQRSHSADIPHDQEPHVAHELDRILASTGMLMSSTCGQYSSSIPPLSLSSAPSSSLPYLDQTGLLTRTSAPWTDSSSLSFTASKFLGPATSTSYKVPDYRLSSLTTTSGNVLPFSLRAVPAPSTVNPVFTEKLSFTSSSLSTPAMLESASKEIDRILQRIEQDNKLLAEIDKSRRTFSSSVPGSPIFSESVERTKSGTEGETRLKEEISHFASKLRSTVTRQELELLMAKLEQDNRILADLDRKRSQYGRPSVPLTSSHLSSVSSLSSGNIIPFGMTTASVTQAFQTAKPLMSVPQIFQTTKSLTSVPQAFQTIKPVAVPASASLITGPATAGTHIATTYSLAKKHPIAPYTTSTTVVAAVPVTVTSMDETQKGTGTEEDALGESSIDHIELPGRGCCKVCISRYTYDPLQQSPNENPEAELALNAGDYVLIIGEMDEDGFFNGELLDGRKGLVPSNFVEMLCGEELFDFQATVLYGNRDSDDSSASFTLATDCDLAGFSTTEEMYSLPSEDYHRMNDYIDLEDIEEVDEGDISDVERETEESTKNISSVPPPQRLILERQLNKSILIGWLPPEGPLGDIQMYHVYVDGILKATVQSSERTRALVEGVDSSQLHRISVRSVTSSGQHSRDAACTITVGKDLPLAPSCVKASNVTSTSALISWLPSNSNFTHSIAVNNVEIRVVKPGRFRHTITGLAPNTLYRVSVRAKPGKLLYNAEKNPKKLDMLTTFVDFRTLPKGLPDPPVDIQVEAGPQDGTLLVTWLPVTINPTGTSNGAPVTGYAVFAAGKKVTEVDSPTGDHALLEVKDLFPLANKSVTVRTKCGDNLSSDSMPCVIPEEFIKTSTQKSRVEEENSLSELSEERGVRLEEEHHRRNRVRDSPLGNGDIGRDHTKSGRDQISPHQSGIHTASDDHNHQQSFDSPHGGRKYISRPHERRVTHLIEERRNSAGQVIIEPDENLSDKEIYPSQNHMPIPSIEITKDTASEGCSSVENFSEEEYEAMRRAHRIQPKRYSTDMSRSRGGQPQDYSADRIGPRPVSPTKSHHLPRDDHNYYSYREEPLVSHCRDDNYSVDSYRGGVSYRGQPPMDVNNQDNRVRWFVALFDYNPHTMSPNPDAAEELPFQEGQLIKIYGGKDPDGFYRGETNGRVGFVPCNMVSEVQLDDEEVAQQLLNENIVSRPHPAPDDGDIDSGSSMPLRKMVALYDYDPHELSPNVDAEMELSFNTGDVIYVYGDMDEDGFFMGEINGVRGLVPSNFLTEAPADYRDNQTVPRERLGPPVVGNVSRPKVAEEPETSHPDNHPEKHGAWLASCSILPTSMKLENHHPSIPEAHPTQPQALKRTIFLHKTEGDASRTVDPTIEGQNGLPVLLTEATTHQAGGHNSGNKRPTTLALKPESGSLKQSKNFETDGKVRRDRKKGIISPKYERKSIFSSMKNFLKPLWRS